MKKNLHNPKNINRKASEAEKRSARFRQYFFLDGKIFDIAEIGGKIHVYL